MCKGSLYQCSALQFKLLSFRDFSFFWQGGPFFGRAAHPPKTYVWRTLPSSIREPDNRTYQNGEPTGIVQPTAHLVLRNDWSSNEESADKASLLPADLHLQSVMKDMVRVLKTPAGESPKD